MKRNTSIKLKAAFLLTVFALNTLVGFACSIGVDMGFNSKHHLDEQESGSILHIHKDGKRHVHHGKDCEIQSRELDEDKAVTPLEREGRSDIPAEKNDDNAKNKSHYNNEAVVHVHKNGKRHVHKEESKSSDNSSGDREKKLSGSTESRENCCTDDVRNFEQLDKSVPNAVKVVHPIFFTVFVGSYYNIHSLLHVGFVRDIKQFVRSYHPPIPDIRIAIQSFQI